MWWLTIFCMRIASLRMPDAEGDLEDGLDVEQVAVALLHGPVVALPPEVDVVVDGAWGQPVSSM